MAALALSHHNLLTLHSFQSTLTSTYPSCSARVRTTPPSPSQKTITSSKISPSPKPQKDTKPSGQSASSSTSSFSHFHRLLSGGFKFDELGLEILSIALPAALSLAADPIASLVDTAFVEHIGSVELAAVGVSVSVFNLVSKLFIVPKLFNVPLLNITTSLVAEEQSFIRFITKGTDEDGVIERQGKQVLPSVSTSLALAASVGIVEAVALFLGSGFLMNIMGIPVDSPMRAPAESFLAWRAFGAPPIVIALAAQGAFRGFKDTKTPLYAIGAGNLLNAILDPLLIFVFGFGVGGAAVSTVISEYLIAFILLRELNSKVLLISPSVDVSKVTRYLTSAGLLIGRTIAVLLTITISTSMAAREGPIPMAGHQICMQVWLAVSLLNDALAIAAQALLAGDYSQRNYEQARQVIYRVLQIGIGTGIALGIILYIGFEKFSSLFTTDSEVLGIAWSGILFVAGTQPINAIAFVLDGLYYGVSDFGYAAFSMVLVAVISSGFILVAAPVYGLAGVWAGLFLFMTLRVVAGIWRLARKTGPWEMVLANIDQEEE